MPQNLLVIFRCRNSELTLPPLIAIPASLRAVDAQFLVVTPQNFRVLTLYNITSLQTDGEVISEVR